MTGKRRSRGHVEIKLTKKARINKHPFGQIESLPDAFTNLRAFHRCYHKLVVSPRKLQSAVAAPTKSAYPTDRALDNNYLLLIILGD
jgi:hypothetical protein